MRALISAADSELLGIKVDLHSDGRLSIELQDTKVEYLIVQRTEVGLMGLLEARVDAVDVQNSSAETVRVDSSLAFRTAVVRSQTAEMFSNSNYVGS